MALITSSGAPSISNVVAAGVAERVLTASGSPSIKPIIVASIAEKITPDFPTAALVGLEDSKYFTMSQADPVKSTDVEGGYRITRPRYTRLPRKTWTTGFSDLTDAEKDSFTDFWDMKRGGSDSFSYLNPANSVKYRVRFKGPPKIKYTGMASLRRWDILDIILEQV